MSEQLLRLDHITMQFGGVVAVDDLNLEINQGEIVALIGPNGVGKSTLFRILTHQINPDHGSVRFGTNIDIGYYDQHQQNLNPQNTILDEVWNAFPKLEQTRIRSALGLFLFTGDEVFEKIEKLSGGDPEKLHAAVGKLIQEIVEEHSAVIFNGDGYSEIWHQEAERRGLPNYRTTPEALMVYTSPDVVDLYSRYNVLSRQELKARQEIYIEQYCKTIRAEANLVIRMGRTIIYPAGLRFQQELLRACLDMRALNREPDTVLLDDIDDTLRKLREGLEHLENNVDMKIEDPVQEAHHKCTVVIPAMNAIRTLADHLETIVPEDLWPLPSYQEMLFVK